MSTSLVSLASLVQAFNPVTPQLRVAAIIVRQKQILLVEHRKRGQRYWVLPGGRLEGHETLDAALRRELKEELGLDARVGAARHRLRELGAGPPRRQPHFSGRDRGRGRAGARPSRSCARRLAVGVGGPAPPAGFPPTHCRSRAGRHRRELCRPRPRARGYVDVRNSVDTRQPLFLFVSDNGPSTVPTHEVAYTAGFFDGEGCVNIARYLKR